MKNDNVIKWLSMALNNPYLTDKSKNEINSAIEKEKGLISDSSRAQPMPEQPVLIVENQNR